MITVAIPVGPYSSCVRWLSEAIESCKQQIVPVDEILLIDDCANLPPIDGVNIYKTPWRIGPAAAFNYGVALAKNELVIMLGSDDKLMPDCIERCEHEYKRNHRNNMCYYWFNIEYDNGEQQGAACNAAMVTKTLWRFNGGFPVESGCGAMDSILISMMLKADGGLGWFYHIMGPPIYWVRRHEGQDTARRGPWQGVIFSTRNILTELHERPLWPEFNAKEYISKGTGTWKQ